MLSDGWLFQPDPLGAGDRQGWQRLRFDRSGWRPVAVPMAWDQYDPVMDGYEGVGWYALALPAERIAPGSWQRLRFGRANHRATVWIDGHEAGGNLTGYLPFEVAATPRHPPAPPEFDDDRIIDLAERALDQMVRRDGNHPSLGIWSMANECQTADDRGVAAMRRLLARVKTLDPTRLATCVANRQFEDNRAFALADLVAVNLYYGMWDGAVADDLTSIEDRVYAPTRRRLSEIAGLFPGKPILLSEFGTIGIPGSGGDLRFSEDYQAACLLAVWRAVSAVPEVSGGIAWCRADYRHRRGFTHDFPTCSGPFGLITFDRRPKKAHAALRALWAADAAAGAP